MIVMENRPTVIAPAGDVIDHKVNMQIDPVVVVRGTQPKVGLAAAL
jgi:hypothetical protein